MLKIQRIMYAQVQVIDAHVYIFILYFGSHSVKCKDSIQFRVLGGFAGNTHFPFTIFEPIHSQYICQFDRLEHC